MKIVVTTELPELETLCVALARHILAETKELRRIQKREAAGKRTRTRSSEQAFYIADVKIVFEKLLKQRNEFQAITKTEALINKEHNHG